MPDSGERRRRGSLLGVVAYVLVPGERRRAAATHFRRAGFEALKGARALVRPEEAPENEPATRRQKIELD